MIIVTSVNITMSTDGKTLEQIVSVMNSALSELDYNSIASNIFNQSGLEYAELTNCAVAKIIPFGEFLYISFNFTGGLSSQCFVKLNGSKFSESNYYNYGGVQHSYNTPVDFGTSSEEYEIEYSSTPLQKATGLFKDILSISPANWLYGVVTKGNDLSQDLDNYFGLPSLDVEIDSTKLAEKMGQEFVDNNGTKFKVDISKGFEPVFEDKETGQFMTYAGLTTGWAGEQLLRRDMQKLFNDSEDAILKPIWEKMQKQKFSGYGVPVVRETGEEIVENAVKTSFGGVKLLPVLSFLLDSTKIGTGSDMVETTGHFPGLEKYKSKAQNAETQIKEGTIAEVDESLAGDSMKDLISSNKDLLSELQKMNEEGLQGEMKLKFDDGFSLPLDLNTDGKSIDLNTDEKTVGISPDASIPVDTTNKFIGVTVAENTSINLSNIPSEIPLGVENLKPTPESAPQIGLVTDIEIKEPLVAMLNNKNNEYKDGGVRVLEKEVAQWKKEDYESTVSEGTSSLNKIDREKKAWQNIHSGIQTSTYIDSEGIANPVKSGLIPGVISMGLMPFISEFYSRMIAKNMGDTALNEGLSQDDWDFKEFFTMKKIMFDYDFASENGFYQMGYDALNNLLIGSGTKKFISKTLNNDL